MEIPPAGNTGILILVIMITEGFTIIDQVNVPDKVSPVNLFERRYIELRSREQRIYSDEELLQLPAIHKKHPHYTEWQVRKRSADKLLERLLQKQKPLQILEVGCGNGWLSKQLVAIHGSKVIGSDVNFTELQQAARVFSHIPNLHFIYGDIRSGLFEEMEFDCIVFAACIQYFPSLPEIISQALSLLKLGGEVHILDSPFYKPAAIPAARQRTADYYKAADLPEMTRHYFHHSWDELADIEHELLYDPSSLHHFFSKNKNPFPWICIKQRAILA